MLKFIYPIFNLSDFYVLSFTMSFSYKISDWLYKRVNCGYSRSLHIIEHLSSFHHLVLFYRILQMNMLNFVILLLLIGVLTAPSFFNSKTKHKTVNFSPYSLFSVFCYYITEIIDIYINWINHLICKIRYIWRNMKESLFKISTHICSSFLSSPPHRSGTFKSLIYLYIEEKAHYSNKNNVRSQRHLIYLSKSHKTKPTFHQPVLSM